MLYKILTVAGLATFEIYAAIPAGFAFGISPWIIFFTTVIGGLAGVFVAAFLGKQIQQYFSKFRKPKEKKENKNALIFKIWEKYGVIGLGFFGTLTVGAPVSIGVGTGLNVSIQKLLIWCCAGVITRCALFTVLGHYGMKLIN
ncbi:MAG: small multi-drug export protein [Sediminibacterium sp.]|jgi:membrane protein YqaA with SNARE-associated domain|uniref:small multi-drug export protein n=1 Tax=Sediminibacterium sp. TaxID=1917865 RepID=UPI001B423D49|nr:small multi-drug export protein [Sediminibacterium sp.]MBP7345017.1 small multi-drug export protein [Sediminibacterium sp.]MDO8996761.1 small multi-drug export protein [Sediminibacterium sp.]